MSEQSKQSGPDPMLLQMSGSLAEIKALQTQHMEQTASALAGIHRDVRDFAERMVALEHRMETAQDDIGRRAHVEEANRLRARIENLESKEEERDEKLATKADGRLVWWVMGLLGALFVTMVGYIFSQVTGKLP